MQQHFQRYVAEVRAGGPIYVVYTVAEVDGVEIRGENLVLRPVLLELPRECRFLQLAGDRALGAGQLVLDELLRDRRAPLERRFVPNVSPEGAPHAAKVDAPVLVEAAVLRRDDRLFDPRRDLGALHEHPALA